MCPAVFANCTLVMLASVVKMHGPPRSLMTKMCSGGKSCVPLQLNDQDAISLRRRMMHPCWALRRPGFFNILAMTRGPVFASRFSIVQQEHIQQNFAAGIGPLYVAGA